MVHTEDGHTDCIRYITRSMPMPAGGLPMAPRELMVRRYWQRDSDGTYLVLFQSVEGLEGWEEDQPWGGEGEGEGGSGGEGDPLNRRSPIPPFGPEP